MVINLESENSGNDKSAPSVAIVCDWLTGIGGAELVVLELHRMFPDAPIYTSQYDSTKIDWFKDADVRTTWLQKLPKGLKKFLPVLRARAFSKLDLSGYDLVISSSGAEAKGIRAPKETTHISYIHSPTHYYWMRYDDYMKNPGFGAFNWLARLGLRLFVGPMRKWDYTAAQRPDYLIANSSFTRDQIKKYYNRDSEVIHPPVDTEQFGKYSLAGNKRRGFVITGRQTPYKRIDLAVAACTKLTLPLTVIGNGPDHNTLLQIAGPSIKFLDNLNSRDEVAKQVGSAQAFLFPGIDDFGIAPVEAMAAGTPVIAFRGGGALDYVQEGKTGLFFDEQTPESLADTLHNFQSDSFSSSEITKYSQKFSVEAFKQKMTSFIREKLSSQ